MSSILAYFARHRTAANLLLLVLLAAGVAAVPRMRAQFFPDIVIDSVSVSVRWEGAGAEDVDAAIVQQIDPALLAVEGVEGVDTTASEGSARFSIDFEPDWDMARAEADVQAAVDAISTLPEGAEDPEVRRSNWRDRVTDVVITGPVDPAQLGLFADEMTARLFAVGVTRTTVRGVAAAEVVVEVPSVALMREGVTMREIAEAIAAEVASDPAGEAADSRVRTGRARTSPEEIASIVLRSDERGELTIGDVATVTSLGSDRDRAYFVGENPAVSLRVDRSQAGDAIAIQRQVEAVAAEMQPTLPEGTSIDLIRTRAEFISGRISLLIDNGLVGLGLVLALLFLFLNARTAFWVAAGIPVAMLATIALMYLGGQTINMISLFALIITLGIVVDDAIVVGEHADFRARELGEPPVTAATNAAVRMSAPVFSATLTTVIAFWALVLIGGRFGSLIAAIPFTVIAVLTASLIECFLILPNHMAHALRASQKRAWYDWPSHVVNLGFAWVRDRLFRPFIRLVVAMRYAVLAGAIALLTLQVAAFMRGDVQWRFFNAPEQSSVTGNFSMLPSATRADAEEMMREMQRAAETVGARYEEEHGTNPILYALAEVGGNSGRGLSGAGTVDQDLLGSIAIELIDADLRPYSSFAFVAALQDEVRQHPLAETVSFRGWRGGPGGDALDVQLFGADAPTLKAAAEDLKLRLGAFPEVSALEDSLAYDKEEIVLDLTPQGRALGFDVAALGRSLRDRLNGIEAAQFPDGVRSGTVRVVLPEGELTADFLARTYLRAGEGGYVPLADIVSVERRSGFSTVRRENGMRVVSVNGDLSEDDPARAEAIMESLQAEILPEIESVHGVSWRLAGLAEQEREFLGDALTGFVFCLLGIYFVLAWIFSSWTRPVVVMAIIPFGLVGTIYGHAAWDVPLSMFTVVGLIGMTGIIINDSIVLVTTIDEHARTRALPLAIVDGVADRLRPVLLTTLTTVLGLMPLLYEQSAQAQFLKPTVITLCYGLAFGMLLVLLVVPALVAMQLDAGRWLAAARRAMAPRTGLAFAANWAGMIGIAVLFALTMGAVMVSGEAPWLPVEGLPAAFGAFLAGSAALLLALWVLASGVQLMRRRRTAS